MMVLSLLRVLELISNSLYTSTLTVMPGSLEVPNGKTINCSSLSRDTIFGLVIFRVGGKLDIY